MDQKTVIPTLNIDICSYKKGVDIRLKLLSGELIYFVVYKIIQKTNKSYMYSPLDLNLFGGQIQLNKCRADSLHSCNTGYGVFRGGIQNYKVFWLKIQNQ